MFSLPWPDETKRTADVSDLRQAGVDGRECEHRACCLRVVQVRGIADGANRGYEG